APIINSASPLNSAAAFSIRDKRFLLQYRRRPPLLILFSNRRLRGRIGRAFVDILIARPHGHVGPADSHFDLPPLSRPFSLWVIADAVLPSQLIGNFAEGISQITQVTARLVDSSARQVCEFVQIA